MPGTFQSGFVGERAFEVQCAHQGQGEGNQDEQGIDSISVASVIQDYILRGEI
jgi:hypothetical protein